jgi:alanyl-tRNA synthetase/REP element-mobilizing transposase RayT
MLGNWSFGDYFKKESLTWGWELLTKVWGIPAKRLFATVYAPKPGDPSEFDHEAAAIWTELFKKEGLDPALHIVHGNRKDNFWQMGDTGPCGPCSEIHFNLLEGDSNSEDLEREGRKLVNSSSSRCIEIWNHVFIQFNANADGTFSPLAAKHVDTGMGFERVAGIMATTKKFTDFSAEPSNYNADVFAPLFAKVTELSGKTFKGTVPTKREGLSEQENIDIAFRVLADHARTISCSIADGILPGNEGRNYVIRRILRRGILYGKKLGLKVGFFEQLVAPVVESLGNVFPELKQQQDLVRRVIKSEEESFGKTLDRGLTVFTQAVSQIPGIETGPGSVGPGPSDGPGSARGPRAADGGPPSASAINDTARVVRYSKRNLPHFERPWGKYHITFSTHARHPLSSESRQLILDAIIHRDTTQEYHLYAACVMPDHVHLLIEPAQKSIRPDGSSEFHALSEILQSLKSYTAHAINKLANTSGPVWDKESFDRLIRSEGDLQEKFTYIQNNPFSENLGTPSAPYPFVFPAPDGVRRAAEPSTRAACAPRTDNPSPSISASISGAIAFQLYDTFGFPLDMTQLLATERGLTVDTDEFERLMEAQKERGRASTKKEIVVAATEGAESAAYEASLFTGYTIDTTKPVDAILTDIVKTDKDTFVVFDRTPFYAEMGGQAGDTGTAIIAGQTVQIADTIKDKSGRYLHKLASVPAQLPPAGATAHLTVENSRRRAISRHHSAAHLIHWALRKVLGTHVRQAGTSKTPDRMRFDFSHFEAVTAAQLREVEQLVNEKVLDNAKVETYETEFDKKPEGTLAFFGDKYGKFVRVVDIGGYSRELCGGTHVSTTGGIGLIKVVSEAAIAAGTRRIEAVAGQAALDYIAQREAALTAISTALSASPLEAAKKLETLLTQQKETEKQLKVFQQKAVNELAADLASKATDRDGLKFVSAVVTVDAPETLRSLGSQVLAKLGEGVVQLGAIVGPDKVSLVAFASPAAIKAGHQAGKIIGELSGKLGGKGGGKPDFAMGGGKDTANLSEVLK